MTLAEYNSQRLADSPLFERSGGGRERRSELFLERRDKTGQAPLSPGGAKRVWAVGIEQVATIPYQLNACHQPNDKPTN